VLEFKEKPEPSIAEEFVASGEYFWNSGIFVWKSRIILDELAARKGELHATIQRIAEAWESPQGPDVFCAEYEKAEKISIDYAVMQDAARAGKVLVIHAPYQWDDVGSWLALERHNAQDADGNTVQGLHAGVETKNCVVVSDPDHLIGTLGVNDLIIIQNENATLITTRKGESDVKMLVDKIKANGLGRFL
jgi:mannose-1-phosphate guanylyltransferase